MIKLFFDIETIPCDEAHKAKYLEILRKLKKHEGMSDDEIHEKMSFEGTYGRICSIGYIKEGPRGIIQKGTLCGDEKEILEKFWAIGADVIRFIGHNIWAFDLPFIYKRSIIHGVRPRPLNFARYRNIPIYDTMLEWELWNFGSSQKLDTLAHVLGLPTSKDEMDGSMVWQYYKDGRQEDICRYCMKDVELTRQVYYKMTFEDQTAENFIPTNMGKPVSQPLSEEDFF